MDFVFEYGFDVKKGKSKQFQEWMRANEERLAKGAPAGWEYIGTYAAVISTEKEAGEFRQLWRMESYGAQDAFAAAMSEGGEFAQAMDEMSTEFIDDERGAPFSQSIMKSVTDLSIWGEE